MAPYTPVPCFPRFLELPDAIQTAIWKHAIPSLLPHLFRWCPPNDEAPDVDEAPGFNEAPDAYPDRHFVDCFLFGTPVSLSTRSGRGLLLVHFLSWDLQPLKVWFNIISTCCRVRKIGLQWWKDAVEEMDPASGWYEEFSSPYCEDYSGWRNDDGDTGLEDGEAEIETPNAEAVVEPAAVEAEIEPASLEAETEPAETETAEADTEDDTTGRAPPDSARLAESKEIVLEIFKELIRDAQWMLDNPEDPVSKRKRLYPPRDDSEMATKTFHDFEKLPRELQIAVWEEHTASRKCSRYADTSSRWSCGAFHHFMHTKTKSDYDFRRHSFVAPKAKSTFYYTWAPPGAIWVCRLSRLLALKAWRKELAGYEDENPCRSCGVSIKALVLQVLEELTEEVEERVTGIPVQN